MLDPSFQRHIHRFATPTRPPMFFATQCALEAPGTLCTRSPRVSQAALSARIPPRVFEIGRGLAFDLSGDLPRGIHPEVPRVLPDPNGRHLAIGLGIVLSGSLLLYLVSPPLKEGDRRHHPARARRRPAAEGLGGGRSARRGRAGGDRVRGHCPRESVGRAVPRLLGHQPVAHGSPPVRRGRALRMLSRRGASGHQAGAFAARRGVRQDRGSRAEAPGSGPGSRACGRPFGDRRQTTGCSTGSATRPKPVGPLSGAELAPEPVSAGHSRRPALPCFLRPHPVLRSPRGAHARAVREVDRSRAPLALRAPSRVADPRGERHHPARGQVRQVSRSLRAHQVAGPHAGRGGQAARHHAWAGTLRTPRSRKRASATGSTSR